MKMKKLLIAFLFAAGAFLHAPAAVSDDIGGDSANLASVGEPTVSRTVELRPGVTLKRLVFERPRLMAAYVIRVDLTTPGIGFTATERDPLWGKPMPDYTNKTWLVNTKRETTFDFMARRRSEGKNVEIAFNTSGFRPWRGAGCYCTYAALYRWVLADGEEISTGKKPGMGAYFVVRKDGSASIRSVIMPHMTNDLAFAVYGNRALLQGGKRAKFGMRTPGVNTTALAPRTALGLSADVKTLVVIAVDGRQPGYSEGASFADLADILLGEGCADAVNMDGGGSTSLVVWDRENSRPKMLNRQGNGYMRKVGLNLGITFSDTEGTAGEAVRRAGDASIFDGAQWIGQPGGLCAAAPRFATQFKAERDGPAEIAICGLGQYVATLNGKPIGCGDEFNLPGWTKTSKTCFYNVFRPVLNAGEEYTLEITLGNGMYNVPSPGGDLYTKFTGSEGDQELLVGGTVKSSPEGWTVAASDVVRTHVYCGDDIDRTVAAPTAMLPVAAVPPKGVLREAPFVCRLQELVKPVRTMRVSDEELTVDFGQNAAYVPTVSAKGPHGSCVEVEFAEMPLLDGETRLSEEATTHRKGGVTRCRFTLAGTGTDETFTPPFFYYGFRYMRLRLLPAREGGERPVFVSAAARVVMADMPSAGSFECSIPLFNKIYDICRWAQRSNMQSVFTDCPHREKLGWQEEVHVHAGQIRWGWNADALFAKTCMDVADSQLEDGLCTCIAPEYVVFRPKFRDSIEWGSSVIQIPWQQYEWTGDDSLIREYWPNMVAYHNYIRSKARDFIAHGALGDWCQETAGGSRPVRRTSAELTATAFYYLNAATLAKCAEMLGKDGEAAEYRAEAENIRDAFNARWWHPEGHCYENNSQAANSLAIAFGLAAPSETAAIVSNIVEDVRGRGNAVGTGEIGYPYLLKVLAENGHDDVIFDMTADDTKPGYGYMIAKGNTSCHEAWDARPDLSHNHFMMADIVDWFYGSLAGIKRTSPGFKTFDVEPKFLSGLDWVKASHRVAGGDIKVEWRREGDAVHVSVSVPEGTTATIRLPGLEDAVQTPGEAKYVASVTEEEREPGNAGINRGIVADFLSKSMEEREAIIADLGRKSRFRHVVPRPEDGPPRFMAVDGVSNMRDIGGWKGLDGRRVRHGLVYRSAAFNTGVRFRSGGRENYEYLFGLSPVTEEEKADFKPSERTISDKGIDELVNGLGIRSDLDLRSPHECYGMTTSPLGAGVKWFHCPQLTYGSFGKEESRRAFAEAFKVFLDKSNYPVIFHCAGGADRTGAIAFMLNGICGVSLDDLRKDWELTVFGTSHAENPGFTHEKRFDRLVAVVEKEPGETLTEKIVSFVKSCGFTDADIERVREIMLPPKELKSSSDAQ